MSEEQKKSPRQQLDDALVDARNEVIVQATNAFLLGRQVVLTGVGMAFLGVDQVQALLKQAVERGEVAESDVQQTVEELRHRLAEGTTSAVSSELATLLNKLPGVSIAYKGSAAPAQEPAAASDEGGKV
jgi:hypothetical protein